MMQREYESYLAHHGVKGQKWGVRHYQNEDGTLINSKKGSSRRDKPESATWKARDARYLSDEELNRRNQRLQRENSYRTNIANNHPVKKEVKDAAKKIFIATAVGAMSAIMVSKYKGGANFVGAFAKYKLGSIKDMDTKDVDNLKKLYSLHK